MTSLLYHIPTTIRWMFKVLRVLILYTIQQKLKKEVQVPVILFIEI
jgi:hypothetical protein